MPDALARLHVEEVIVEALIARSVGRIALRALEKEPENLERPRGGFRTRQPAVADRDGIAGQRKPDHRDAAGRSSARRIRDEAGIGIAYSIK